MLKMTEQAPPTPPGLPPVAEPQAEEVVSAANVLEVPKDKDVGQEMNAEEEGKEGSGSSSSGEKKIINIGA
jgi:hypothetical protein